MITVTTFILKSLPDVQKFRTTGCSGVLRRETAGKNSRHGGAREKKTKVFATGTSYNLHHFE